MVDEKPKPPVPVVPLLVFAAIDLALALFLLLDGGFTLHFWLIALIGVALAIAGLLAGRRRPAAE